MSLEWGALIGEYSTHDDAFVFKGRTVEHEGQPFPALGNFLSNRWLSSGTVEATFRFSQVEPATSAALILNYDLASKAFLAAGIGGPALYSIRSFAGQWNIHDSTGETPNLQPDRDYHLKATLMGSRVALSVNGVQVLSTQITFPLQRSQVGLFFLSHHEVRVSGLHVQDEKPTAFVVMQFSSPFNEIYAEVIQRVCTAANVLPKRADETFGPGVIIADIARQIVESHIVIAEISPGNPNVYYEVGFAHALRKPTILIAEKGTPLPFDVSPFRVLFYENSILGKARFEDGLRRHIEAIIGSRVGP